MTNVIPMDNRRDQDAVVIGTMYRTSGRSLIEAVNGRLECGRLLLKKKKEISHGDWMQWLADNESVLGFKERAAQKMMSAANAYPGTVLTEEAALKLSRQTWDHDSEIKQVTKRKPVTDTYISPEIDDEGEDEKRVPGQLPNSTRIRGLINRAREAIEMAETDDLEGVLVSDEAITLVGKVVEAWMKLGHNLMANNTTEENEDA